MSLPPTLGLTILRRLSFLPEDTLQALRCAAILGSGFSLTDLSATMDRPALTLSQALAEAIRAQVIEDDGIRLRFRHDLIREAIYTDMPDSVRLALHREAGAWRRPGPRPCRWPDSSPGARETRKPSDGSPGPRGRPPRRPLTRRPTCWGARPG